MQNANHMEEDWNWIQDECMGLRYAIDGLMCITIQKKKRRTDRQCHVISTSEYKINISEIPIRRLKWVMITR